MHKQVFRWWPLVVSIVTVAGLGTLVGLGVFYRQRWSWMVIPTWVTAGATVGLLAGAVITARYAARAFDEQRGFNSQQVKFNEHQLEISRSLQLIAEQAERRQRTPRFRADVLTRNDGSVSLYLHLRLLSEEPLDRIDVKLLDKVDGFPVDCPIGFTPGQWGVPDGGTSGSSAWDGPRRYQEAGLRDRAWWPADPAVDADVSPGTCTHLDVGGGAVWQFQYFPAMDWPPFAHLRVVCAANGEQWTVTLDVDLAGTT